MLADDLITTFRTAQAAFTERVHAVARDQWELGTPDEQWTVADLVWHLVDEHRWAGPLLAGLDLDNAAAVAAGLGPDSRDGATLVREWDRAAASSAAAFSADGALTASVTISRGRVPAPEYLEEMILDLIVHAWDLGTAIGYQRLLPAGAVAAIYPLAQAIIDRTPRGMFGPPAKAGADTPLIDRLVAMTGRRPALAAGARMAEASADARTRTRCALLLALSARAEPRALAVCLAYAKTRLWVQEAPLDRMPL